jgi:hypothetical protein
VLFDPNPLNPSAANAASLLHNRAGQLTNIHQQNRRNTQQLRLGRAQLDAETERSKWDWIPKLFQRIKTGRVAKEQYDKANEQPSWGEQFLGSGGATAVGGLAGAGIGALAGGGVPGALLGSAIGTSAGSLGGSGFGGQVQPLNLAPYVGYQQWEQSRADDNEMVDLFPSSSTASWRQDPALAPEVLGAGGVSRSGKLPGALTAGIRGG